MEDLNAIGTRRERRKAEMLAARSRQEPTATSIDMGARVTEEATPPVPKQPHHDPRFREMSPFNDLMGTSRPTLDVEPPKKEKKESRFSKTGAEWRHAVFMEFLRVPIMVPIWWAGMQLCEVFWKHR
jgi:hypothetical protein